MSSEVYVIFWQLYLITWNNLLFCQLEISNLMLFEHKKSIWKWKMHNVHLLFLSIETAFFSAWLYKAKLQIANYGHSVVAFVCVTVYIIETPKMTDSNHSCWNDTFWRSSCGNMYPQFYRELDLFTVVVQNTQKCLFKTYIRSTRRYFEINMIHKFTAKAIASHGKQYFRSTNRVVN